MGADEPHWSGSDRRYSQADASALSHAKIIFPGSGKGMTDLYRYAAELEELGELKRAIAEYGDLADARLGGREPLVRRAELFRRLGRLSEAEAELRDALFHYASELEEVGQTDRAIAEYNDLIAAGLGGVEPLVRRADLFHRVGRLADAEADFRQAAHASPDDGRPWFRLAQLALETERLWLAARYIQAAIEREPQSAEFRIMAAKILLPLGWFDRAFAVVRPLPSDLPDLFAAMKRYAEEQYRLYRANALARCRAYRERPNEVIPAFELAIALFYVGRIKLASTLCEAVMRYSPDSFTAFDFYVKIVARRDGARRALEFLRARGSLHSRNPGYAQVMDSLSGQIDPI